MSLEKLPSNYHALSWGQLYHLKDTSTKVLSGKIQCKKDQDKIHSWKLDLETLNSSVNNNPSFMQRILDVVTLAVLKKAILRLILPQEINRTDAKIQEIAKRNFRPSEVVTEKGKGRSISKPAGIEQKDTQKLKAAHSAFKEKLKKTLNIINRWESNFIKKMPKERADSLKSPLNEIRAKFPNRDLKAELKSLDKTLKNKKSYIANQDRVVHILDLALQVALEKGDINDAKCVYKKVTEFLRKNTPKDRITEYKYYLEEYEYSPSQHSGGTYPAIYLGCNMTKNSSRFHALLYDMLYKLRIHIKLAKTNSVDSTISKKLKKTRKEMINVTDKQWNKAKEYLGLTWMHGTKAFTISAACKHTDQNLIPSGKLMKDKVLLLTGEMGIGTNIFGVNQTRLSGVGLLNASISLEYMQDFDFSKEEEEALYSELLNKKYTQGRRELYYSFARSIEAVKRIKLLDPKRFIKDGSQWINQLEEMVSYLEKEIFQNSKEVDNLDWEPNSDGYYLLQFIHNFKHLESVIMEPSATSLKVSAEDLKLAKTGVVLASKKVYGMSPTLDCYNEPREEVVYGSVSLNKDIDVVFTTDDNIDTVKGVLQQHHLDHIKVESDEVLRLSEEIFNSIAPYLVDVYNRRKWKSLKKAG